MSRFFAMRGKRGFGPQGPFGPQDQGDLFGPGGPFGPEVPHGPRGPFGPRGPHGHHQRGQGPFEGRHFFGRGDVKYALLALMQERPMHGYEMMKALEERSNGLYVPSAGTIYPTLQMLEDRGLISVQEVEGKKVYSITDDGRKALADRQQEEDQFAHPFWGRFGPHAHRWDSPEIHALRSEAAGVAQLFVAAARQVFFDESKAQRLRAILERTRKDLSDLIYDTGAKPQEPNAASPEAGNQGEEKPETR
ncbi:PadR family transcriptional regulator [Ktedonosporobacter rubrisoli]|uniref:PadR family transcriptional regulator n=2 Tax=Ktedonosporobacter rubrisoli TaxID=2509675 RepID=A0A4P6K551_KTERU|nr:PadR family transcriptional regulator [Ktedonosporobacter rubrisoli]